MATEQGSKDYRSWLTPGGKIGNKIKLLQRLGAWLGDLFQMPPLKDSGKELAFQVLKARSSVGERFLDTEEVGSSILPVPTIILIRLRWTVFT